MNNLRKLAAQYIITPGRKPIRYGLLEVDQEGRVVSISQADPTQGESSKVEFYNGILVPGFINVHAHLELSHLKGHILPNLGLQHFVQEVVKKRDEIEYDPSLLDGILAKMHRQGTQAIGDICNTSDSLIPKTKSPIFCYNFVELFGQKGNEASSIWQKGIALQDLFTTHNLRSSLTPHSSYSISQPLWKKFKQHNFCHNTLSIHHQESQQESIIHQSTKPPIHQSTIPPIHQSTIHQSTIHQSTIPLDFNSIPDAARYLLIHNTYTTKDDLINIEMNLGTEKVFFGLCPNANRYIENQLPESLIKNRTHLQLCIGTDSLASNHQISMLEEMKTIQAMDASITLPQLIEWTCLNGARALGMDKKLGSFENGKRPGVVLIEKADMTSLRLTVQSTSRRII